LPAVVSAKSKFIAPEITGVSAVADVAAIAATIAIARIRILSSLYIFVK
jgi:hypothetical protein